MKSIIRVGGCFLIALTLAGAPHSFAADNWPSRPVTLIVPFAAGGTTDLVARPVAQKLSEAFKQQFVVDNRPGAGGTLAAGLVARAKPDGYTLFVATVAHTIATTLYKNLPYSFERGLEPITVTATVPSLLVVHPSMPVRSVKDLIALAKTKPGEVSYGSAGSGSIEHLSGEIFKTLAGVEIGSAAPHVKNGEVRALVASTAQRSTAFPDLPTLAEAGVPGYDVTTWYAILAPKGTPREIVDNLCQQIAAILKTP